MTLTLPVDAPNFKAVVGVDSERSGRLQPKRKAYLVPQDGEGSLVSLDSPQLVVGRGRGTDCCIADSSASRRHARILAVHNRYFVQDLGSANGTFVNFDKVTHARLAHGDLLAFGKTLFRFVVTDHPDTEYLEKLSLAALTSLAAALEYNDPYNRGHSESVARVAERLALELGFSPAAVERVGIGARLLDIGMIAVPDSVLRKEGPLDPAELALMRQHPVDGESILAPLAFLADVLPMVRQHHERFDGRGYPDGLAGQAIAEEARIVHVADAYYSMASPRPYRKPLYQEFIRMEFTRGAGSQFDPEVTRAFLRILPSVPGFLATPD